MKFKIGKIHCEFVWLKERPERAYYRDGVQFASVMPFMEIGVDEREDSRIYYFGLMRISWAISIIPSRYIPSWVYAKKALGKCIPFRQQKKKRIKHDPFNKPMGDKPSA